MVSLGVVKGRNGSGPAGGGYGAEGSGGGSNPGGLRDDNPERTIAPRHRLPGSRAVTGGLLIAVAGIVAFAGYTGATRTSRQLYVVAARPLAPGDRLRVSDLGVVPVDIPGSDLRRQLFSSTAPLIGASVLAPINPGALVESSAVVGRGGEPGTRELSLSLDRSRAVGGTLKPGEYVDVLGTFGSGAQSYTALMVAHARVISIAGQGGSLGDSRTEVVVFSVRDGVEAEALADAGIATQVTLVRSAEQPAGVAATTLPAYHAPSAGVDRSPSTTASGSVTTEPATGSR